MIRDLFRETIKSLSANKVRSGLTILGIVIGIASVIALVGIGQGAKNSMTESIESIGSNLIMVMPGSQRVGGISQGSGSSQTLTESTTRKPSKADFGRVQRWLRTSRDDISSQLKATTRTRKSSEQFRIIHSPQYPDEHRFVYIGAADKRFCQSGDSGAGHERRVVRRKRQSGRAKCAHKRKSIFW